MKIYTRKGDQGKTQLFGDCRVLKTHPRVKAYGSLDELNSFVGWAASLITKAPISSQEASKDLAWLKEVQREIFKLGSQVACVDQNLYLKLEKVDEAFIQKIEGWIDDLESELPALKNFILPGGSIQSAALHICRTQCRKSERTLVELQSLEETQGDSCLGESLAMGIKFLNRLSDFLFVEARWHNLKSGIQDELW